MTTRSNAEFVCSNGSMTGTIFFFYCCGDLRYLHSFPTRRSSDLASFSLWNTFTLHPGQEGILTQTNGDNFDTDRKSTRLNSSHVEISYAVFCLKKKRRCQSCHLAGD